MNKLVFMLAASVISSFIIAGCSKGTTNTVDTTASDSGTSNSVPADPSPANGIQQPSSIKDVCLQLTTACENGTTKFHYNYAENIGDGRGVTFGIVGFTTGTYDGNVLIKYYTKLNPDNSLSKYIPALDKIDSGQHDSDDKSDRTAGLDGFIEAIRNCSDPLFKQAQLYELDVMYWNPSVKLAESIGIKNPLTLAFIYDTCVNSGADGAQDYIDSVTEDMGGSPATGINETDYLRDFMEFRYDDLKTDDPNGAGRVKAFRKLLDSGNTELKAPFEFTVYGDTYTIDGNVY